MMPRSLLAFSAAVVLLLVAMASPRQREDRTHLIPLDLQGITEVEIRAPNARVDLGSALPSAVEHPLGPDHEVTVTRQGTRLLIESNISSYPTTRIRLPASVARLTAKEVSIEAHAGVGALEIEVAQALEWSGDAAWLRVVHTGAGPKAEKRDAAAATAMTANQEAVATTCGTHCMPQLAIHHGRIDRLDIRATYAHVSLHESDDIGHAQLDLGPGASFALGRATRLENLHLGAPAPAVEAPTANGMPQP